MGASCHRLRAAGDHFRDENFARRCDVITLEFENIPFGDDFGLRKHAADLPECQRVGDCPRRLRGKNNAP